MYGIKIQEVQHDSNLLGCIYRSPSLNPNSIHEIRILLEKITNSKYSHLCIVRDFEANNNTCVNVNHPASLFLEVVRDNFLIQHVQRSTRYREGVIP